MTEEERLARRIRFALAQGMHPICQAMITGEWLCLAEGVERPKNGSTSRHILLPNPDHNAEEWRGLLGWFTRKPEDVSLNLMRAADGVKWAAYVNNYQNGDSFRGEGDTLTEAVLCAIDAALAAKGEKENGR